MSFKENLQKKIAYKRWARRVKQSLGGYDSSAKFDKETMRKILDAGGFERISERDLELYVLENGAEKKKVLVLDNGLAIYNTTIDDVVMRKSPTVKEMISIRNAKKILKDKDVVLSKRETSLEEVLEAAIGQLDLSYTENDLYEIEKQGQASLDSNYPEGVLEALELFAELLGFTATPKAFQLPHCVGYGHLEIADSGQKVFGPSVIYDRVNNRLIFSDLKIEAENKAHMRELHSQLDGGVSAAAEGGAVFSALKTLALESP
jgi:hypothetical protein